MNHTFRPIRAENKVGESKGSGPTTARAAHLDIEADSSIPASVVARRATGFLLWIIGFLASTALVGMLPTTFIFCIAFMRVENREPWGLALAISTSLLIFTWYVFESLLALPWPRPLVSMLFPELRDLVPSW